MCGDNDETCLIVPGAIEQRVVDGMITFFFFRCTLLVLLSPSLGPSLGLGLGSGLELGLGLTQRLSSSEGGVTGGGGT